MDIRLSIAESACPGAGVIDPEGSLASPPDNNRCPPPHASRAPVNTPALRFGASGTWKRYLECASGREGSGRAAARAHRGPMRLEGSSRVSSTVPRLETKGRSLGRVAAPSCRGLHRLAQQDYRPILYPLYLPVRTCRDCLTTSCTLFCTYGVWYWEGGCKTEWQRSGRC